MKWQGHAKKSAGTKLPAGGLESLTDWSSGKLLEIQESKNILTIRRAYQIDWKAFLPILSYFIKTKQTHHEVVIKFCFRVSILNQMNEVVRRISSLILKVLLFKLLWYEFAWFLTSEWMMSMIPRKFWVSLFSFFNTLLSFSLLFFVEEVASNSLYEVMVSFWWLTSISSSSDALDLLSWNSKWFWLSINVGTCPTATVFRGRGE